MKPPRLAVLYVQHSPERHAGVLATLRSYLDRLWSSDPVLVVIDNKVLGRDGGWVSDREAIVGGDNSDWEFSGWQRGIEFVRAGGVGCDMFLLTNESFLGPGPSFLAAYPTYDDLCRWHADGLVAGRVDRHPTPLTLCGRAVESWVCTSAMFIPDRAVAHIGRVPTFSSADMNRFLPETCPPALAEWRTVYFDAAHPDRTVTCAMPLPSCSGGLLTVRTGGHCDPRDGGERDTREPLGVLAESVRVGGLGLEDAAFRTGWSVQPGGAWSSPRSSAGFAGPFGERAIRLDFQPPPWASWPGHRRDVVVRFTADPFLPDAPVSATYRLHLLDWLTERWRLRFDLGPVTWPTFRRKVQSILNEASLTRRLRDAGYRVVDAAPVLYY